MDRNWIKNRRTELGWPVTELCSRSGYARSTIQAIEASDKRFLSSKWQTIHELVETMGYHFEDIPSPITNEWLFEKLQQQGIDQDNFCANLGFTTNFYKQLQRGIAHVNRMKTESILIILDFLDISAEPIENEHENPAPEEEFDEAANDKECEEKLVAYIKKGTAGRVPCVGRKRRTKDSYAPKTDPTEQYRMEALKIAVECHYGADVVIKLQAAKTRPEMEHILQAALFAS